MGRASSGTGGDPVERRFRPGCSGSRRAGRGAVGPTVSPALTWYGVAPKARARAEGRWASSTVAWVMKIVLMVASTTRMTVTTSNHAVDLGEQRVSESGLVDHDVGALAAGEAAVQGQSADDHDVGDEEAEGGEDGPTWAADGEEEAEHQ